jgi:hypothetical protein
LCASTIALPDDFGDASTDADGAGRSFASGDLFDVVLVRFFESFDFEPFFAFGAAEATGSSAAGPCWPVLEPHAAVPSASDANTAIAAAA